jgi:hypothetical protein
MRKYPTNSGPFKEAIFLEREEIDSICCDELISTFLYPSSPEPIRIERYLEKRFKITPDYDELSDGVLGMTIFGPSGPERVVIARSLSENNSITNERRITTTIAHEIGHILFHTDLILESRRKSSQRSFFGRSEDNNRSPIPVLCRDIPLSEIPGSKYQGPWWEIQANKAIGSFLIPRGLMEEALDSFLIFKKTRLGVFEEKIVDPSKLGEAIIHLSETFDVNPIVAKIRIREVYRDKNRT